MAGYSTTSEPAIYAFGPYRLDMGQRLLLHDNRPVPLAPKAIALLCVLVENHGKLVERERLMQMVWPGAFVEDGNLTVTVFALRKALAAGLGATVIENIPRRGYRFVAPVSLVEPAAAAERLASVSSPTVAGSVPAPAAPSRRPRTVELGLAAATALGALLIAFPRPAPQVADVRQISHFGQADGLGTDGARVFAGKRQGGRVTLVQFGPQGGDASDFPLPFASIRLLDVSSVRKEALVAATDVPGEWPVWIVPLSGRAPRRLGTVQSPSARWSADGKRVAYGADDGLYVAWADGSAARKLTSEAGAVDAWSPDGSRLSYTVTNPSTGGESLWEIRTDGSGRRPMVPERALAGTRWGEGQCCGRWTPDGRYFLFREAMQGRSEIWALPDATLFGMHRAAARLYSAAFDARDFAVAPDGKRLLVIGVNQTYDFVRFDPRLRRWVPVGLGPRVSDARWSPDGQWIAYVRLPERTLWKMRSDGSSRTQLTFPPAQVFGAAWSPDSQKLAFHILVPGGPGKIAVIANGSRQPRIVLAGQSTGEDSPNWSPDGKRLLFLRYWLDPKGQTTHSAICLLDRESGEATGMAGTDKLGPPEWSPNGRYIAAQSEDFRSLMLFDFESRRWTPIAHGGFIHAPKWSRDSRSVFFQDRAAGEEQPIYQISIPDFLVRKIAGRSQLMREDVETLSLSGLTPDNLPIATATHNNSDIYALSLTGR